MLARKRKTKTPIRKRKHKNKKQKRKEKKEDVRPYLELKNTARNYTNNVSLGHRLALIIHFGPASVTKYGTTITRKRIIYLVFTTYHFHPIVLNSENSERCRMLLKDMAAS